MPEELDLSAGEIDLSAGEMPVSDLDRVRSVLSAQNKKQRVPSPAEMQGLDLTSRTSATFSGIKEFGKGLLDLLPKPPETVEEGATGAVLGPGGQILRSLIGLGKQAAQVPGAVQDIAASDDPLGTVAAGAPRVGGQAAGALALQKITSTALAKSAPPSKAVVTEELTKAINPAVQDVPGFKANLANNIDDIVSHAKDKGLPLTTRAEFASAAESAAESHPYRQIFIEPNKSLRVDLPLGKENLYQGNRGVEWFGGPRQSPTIAELDARLTTINRTLTPKIEKGGAGSMAAQAAIGAEQAAALNAEAVMIRNLLADTLGKKAGVNPKIVYELRGKWGQMKNVAEEAAYAHNEAMSKQFARQQQPLTLRKAKETAMDAPLNPRYWGVESPADVMVRNALSRYKPGSGGGGY